MRKVPGKRFWFVWSQRKSRRRICLKRNGGAAHGRYLKRNLAELRADDETDETVAETTQQPAPLGALVLGEMSVPEPAEAPTTRVGLGRWTSVLWLDAGYIHGHSCV